MIAIPLAQYLHARGLVIFNELGAGGDCFIDTMPQTPNAAVGIFHTGGQSASFGEPYDTPTVQLMVRGGPDPRVSHARVVALYEACNGLGPVTLPGDVHVISCIAGQSAPVSIGLDENGRHRHTVNLTFDIYHPTELRPAH